ncbi:N-acetylneuraminate synthase, partial [Escherichia coli]|nr:N-acetylneuraminate synthase [Escherichia coli]
MSNIYIVAEIGCNHNGSVDIAREMILKAKEAGVNAVKFQTFKADKLISAIAPKAEYQIKNTGELESQLEMTKKLEMKYDDYLHLMEYAVSLNLDVFSTPFDEDSI